MLASEAVKNAARHAGASTVTILLNRNGGTLRLTIADDGKGMPPRCVDHQGMGLSSMRFRARALGGELGIESSPENGTVISCKMPYTYLQPLSSTL
jgi:signal transduction histidine kinase